MPCYLILCRISELYAYREHVWDQGGPGEGHERGDQELGGVQGVSKVTTAAAAELQRRDGVQINDYHIWNCFFKWEVLQCATQACLEQDIAWGGKTVSFGQVLFVRSSATSSSRRQCDGGGGSGLFSDSDSFYQLCQLSALSASILRLSEQTKTGATRGRGR